MDFSILRQVFSSEFKGPNGELVDHMILPNELVHYTSAQAAFDIISARDDKRCLWLRNATEMNDFKELSYGQELIAEAFDDPQFNDEFNSAYRALGPDTADVSKLMEESLDAIRRSTFLLSLSQHSASELESGRLSMWRAYGGNANVALVFNVEPIYSGEYSWPVIISSVKYDGVDEVRRTLRHILAGMIEQKSHLEKLPGSSIENALKDAFEVLLLTTKHPGFSEEQEWRLIHRDTSPPLFEGMVGIPSKIACIGGIVQKIHYLPFRRPDQTEVTPTGLNELLAQIIIGPTSNEAIVKDGFVQLLRDAKVDDPESRVTVSGIPLRR